MPRNSRLTVDFASLDPRDTRSSWQEVTPRDGLTLRQAMLSYYEEDRTEEFRKQEARMYPSGVPPLKELKSEVSNLRILDWGFPDLYKKMASSLIRKLVSGDLVATAYAGSSGIDEPARMIPADRWRTLELDITASLATGPGVVLSGVLIFEKPSSPSRPQKRPAGAARLRRWYLQWIEQNEAAGCQPSRDEDLVAATDELQAHVSREHLRKLRRELAPPAWSRGGRPKFGPKRP